MIIQALPAYLFQVILIVMFLVLDPLYLPKVAEQRPVEASREARDIVMQFGGDSILLHLPQRKLLD